jgi:hypothetical protein
MAGGRLSFLTGSVERQQDFALICRAEFRRTLCRLEKESQHSEQRFSNKDRLNFVGCTHTNKKENRNRDRD